MLETRDKYDTEQDTRVIAIGYLKLGGIARVTRIPVCKPGLGWGAGPAEGGESGPEMTGVGSRGEGRRPCRCPRQQVADRPMPRVSGNCSGSSGAGGRNLLLDERR